MPASARHCKLVCSPPDLADQQLYKLERGMAADTKKYRIFTGLK
jgi:hypothetical protein